MGGTYGVDEVVPGSPDFNWHGTYGYMNSWCNVVYPYVKNVQIFRCPSQSTSVCMGVDYGMPWHCVNSSGALTYLFYGRSTTLGELLQPSETMMIVDKSGGNPQYVMSGTYPMCGARHNEGGNLVYCDGHAKWQKFSDAQLPAPWPAHHGYPAGSKYLFHPDAEVLDNAIR